MNYIELIWNNGAYVCSLHNSDFHKYLHQLIEQYGKPDTLRFSKDNYGVSFMK